MSIEHPADIHDAVTTCFNAGDIEGLMELYEPEARMVGMDDSVLEGHAAIRENWTALLAFGGHMTLTTRYVIEFEDIALLSNDYTVSVGDDAVTGATAEVVRRQPDGSWKYVIDHPTGAGAPPELPA